MYLTRRQNSLPDVEMKNGTKNYCFWTISSKIFQNRPAIKIVKDNYTFLNSCLDYSILKQDPIKKQGRKPSRFPHVMKA